MPSFKNAITPGLVLCLVPILSPPSCSSIEKPDRSQASQLHDGKPAPEVTAASGRETKIFPYRTGGFSGSDEMPQIDPKDADLLQISDSGDAEAKAELMSYPEFAARERENSSASFGGWSPPDEWRPAASLMKLRAQIKAIAPNRDTSSDGMVGDYPHWRKGSASDHNPWVKDRLGSGVVTGYDITNNPLKGCNVDVLVESLIRSKDSRIKYIIWKRRIISSDSIGGNPAWKWRPYSGSNPHDKHMHLSVFSNPSKYDSNKAWAFSVK